MWFLVLYFSFAVLRWLAPYVILIANNQSIMQVPFLLLLIYGVSIILYDIFTKRVILRDKTFPLFFMLLLFMLMANLVNIRMGVFGFFLNIYSLIFVAIELFVISILFFSREGEKQKRNIKIVNACIVWIATTVSILSFITFVFDINGFIYINDYQFGYGFMPWNRLHGVTINSGFLSELAFLGMMFALIQLRCFPVKRKWPYIVSLIVCFFCALLGGGRSSSLSFYGFVAVFSFLYFLLNHTARSPMKWAGRSILRRVVCGVLVCALFTLSTIALARVMVPALGYVPAVVSSVSERVQNIGATGDEEEQPTGADQEEESPNIVPIDTVRNVEHSTDSGRVAIWRSGLRTAGSYPFWGVGWAASAYHIVPNIEDDVIVALFADATVMNLHNDVLQILTTHGVFVLLVVVFIAGYFALRGIKKLSVLVVGRQDAPFFVAAMSGLAYYLARGLVESTFIQSPGGRVHTFAFVYFLGMFLISMKDGFSDQKEA